MNPAFSFRTKLVLAMSLVVAGVTISTIAVTEHSVQAGYQRLFEEQFNLQTQAFTERRARQLQEVSALCRDLAERVRVVSALEEALDSDDPDLLYDNLDIELETLVKRRGNAPEETSATDEREVPANAMVVDASGRPLLPKKARAYFPKSVDVQQGLPVAMFQKRLTTSDLEKQETGYLAVKHGGTEPELREYIITPLINQSTYELLGAIVISYPVQEYSGTVTPAVYEGQSPASGIWLEGRLYAPTIPLTLHAPVNRKVTTLMQGSAPPSSLNKTRADTPLYDGDTPHRLFIKELPHTALFPAAAQVGLYSLDQVLKEQRGLRMMILGFGIFALIAGIGLVMIISHGFSKPIEALVHGTNLVREGNFDTRVEVRTRDELGALAASFNAMAADLALKERYRTVLSQVTDKEVAAQMISGRITLGGELREVSVLFCDIRGFTALTENMPPTEVIAMLNEHMTALNRLVHAHHGVVDKFVGDLIMAVFGAPKTYGEDAWHAAKCALEMVRVRTELNQKSPHQIEMGIGVATGEVVAGCMGSRDRLNYTVLGERVNLASRLCSKAGRMEVLIDQETRLRLPLQTMVDATGTLELKGFSEPVPAFRLHFLPPPAEPATRYSKTL
ncbi:MAG: adenylate/guanylate cyclase domain-containing protein [Verrucomicrobium sp.]|nr:adenylate/guanylate cyclase domain-containing protein [Verrucomicrobium sp.]